MAYEVEKVNHLACNAPTIMPFIAGGALAKGALVGFTSGKLALATADVRILGILLQAAGADNDVRSVEVLGPEALIRIHCTSAPQVGLRYDVKSDGLELDQADTTKYKLEVLEYDSVSAYAICRIVNYAQIAA
jgi:hypothetical protein